MGVMPEALPSPLIYGPSFPRIGFAMRDGRQRFESRTNRNLFFTEKDFTRAGTFTMARFLTTLEPCTGCQYDDIFPLSHYCSLVATPGADDEGRERCTWWQPPDFSACPGFQILMEFCQWPAQKNFLEDYCRALSAGGLKSAYNTVVTPVEESVRARYADDDYEFGRFYRSLQNMARELQFGFPALIPEVWLNAIGRDKTEADAKHLEENPQRVDFVMFANGQKVVVEIDGPSHYADFDETTGAYTVSEERYTLNLRIERSLRRQGWEIHRFSNYEVLGADSKNFAKLTRDLPCEKEWIDAKDVRPYVEEFDEVPF